MTPKEAHSMNQSYQTRLREILNKVNDAQFSLAQNSNSLTDLNTLEGAQQAITDLFLEVVGEDEQMPVEYFDEVEKSNVRKYPTYEMTVRNMFRDELRKAVEGTTE